MFSFNLEKVNFDQLVGTGNWGAVYPYQKNPEDQKWVVKHLVTPNTDIMLKHFNEIVLGFSCDHPNVLPIKGYNIHFEPKQKTWNIYLKTPRMVESLKDKMTRLSKDNTFMSEKEIIEIFYAISSGLTYLHNRKISHNDIKPDNILVDVKGSLKVADIGIGELLEGETTYDVLAREGTASYSAPEVLDANYRLKKGDLLKADAWSLGVVMAELCTLKFKLVNVLASGETKEAEFRSRLEQAKSRYNNNIIELILNLLRSDPKQRKTIAEVHSILRKEYAEALVLLYAEIYIIIQFKGLNDINKVQEDKQFDEELEKSSEEEKIEDPIEVQNQAQLRKDMESSIESVTRQARNMSISHKEFEEKWSKLFQLEFRQDEKRLEALLDWTLKFTEADAKSFIKDIQANKKQSNFDLEGLILSFRGNKQVTDKEVKELANQIGSNLKFLKSLSLNFSRCEELTESSLKVLSDKIATNLKELQTLRLSFNFCQKISDSSIQKLFSEIGSSLKQLTAFGLGFNSCTQLTDKSIQKLALQFKANLVHVESLNLCFNACDKVTDLSLKELIASLPLSSRSFILHLMNCKKITDQTLAELTEHTKTNLKSLTTFILLCYECDSLTDAAVTLLASHIIQHLKSLRFLMLYFER